ncbi:MAG: helicase-exonuclease AddAB subunit AddA [Lachnospiraceae bacterium]|nr:helicase-exonuclease AddAB subunit AddA [Lachnospiraceae bacterium]
MAEIRLTPEQQKVVDTRNCNLLVAAAAGSGKTAVLVKRIIKKVTEEKQDIDRLLIVTFTNAAAAEMRERIGAAIESALEQNPENTHLQRQMLLLHNAQITTIHSFCLSVIREFFHRIELDPGFRIGDEAELSLLKSDVLEEVLEECYEKEETSFLSFTECFGSARNDEAVMEYVRRLYNTAMSQPWPEQWLDGLTEAFRLSKEEFLAHPMLEQVCRAAKSCLTDCLAVAERMIALTEEADGPFLYRETFEDDRAVLRSLAAAATDYMTLARALDEFKLGRLSSKKQEVSEEKKQLAKNLREHIKKQIKKLKEDFFYEDPEELWNSIVHMEQPMQGLVSVTKAFAQRYEKEKAEKNLLDFNDLEHKALKILVEQAADGSTVPTEAAKTLSARYDEIMIDEYQDSNLIQELVLTSVSGAWREQPNVFMVGDVKQSIYRFRMACPELFMQKYETYGESGKQQKIDLAKNFRSRKGILDAINVLFAGLMHKESTEVEYDAAASLYFGASYPKEKEAHGTEVLFVSMQEEKEEASGTGAGQADSAAEQEEESVTAETVEEGELSQEEKTKVQAEAFAVAQRIRELMHSDLTIGSEERNVDYGDIVILLRTMSGWSEAFLEVFAEQGIPAYADTSSGYFKTFEIRKTLDFLRILDNPKQDIPFAAVLHSPIGGFCAEEMAELRVKYGTVSMEHKTNRCLYEAAREAARCCLTGKAEAEERTSAIGEKAARFFELYDRLREEAEYVSIHELMEHFYRYSGFYDVVTVMPGGERRRGNLDMLTVRAKQYESTSFSGLYDFIRYIDRLIKYEVDFGEAGNGDTGKMVRIMSIHKSKGLEFPVVFLCGMEKKFNRQDMKSRMIFHAKLGLGPEFVDTELRVKSATLLKKIIARQMNEEMIAEELRVLYVAMTRAREKLILVGTMKQPEKRYAAWKERSETVNERGMLASYISRAETYYDFVCPLLFAGNAGIRGMELEEWGRQLSAGEKIKVSLLKQMEEERFPEAEFQGNFVLWECGREAQERQRTEVQRTKEELLLLLEQMKTMGPDKSETAKEIRTLLDLQEQYRYPYGTEADLPVKVTVSELKRLHLEEAEQEEVKEEVSFEDIEKYPELMMAENSSGEFLPVEDDASYPEFLLPEKTISSADRGTIYHHVMELFPFEGKPSRKKVQEFLDTMVQEGKLRTEEREIISDYKVWKFFDSSLGKRMCQAEAAGKLHREQPFVLGLTAKELYPETNSGETVLVQGIIDAFFEEEDGLVLMDYKTDYIHTDAKEELTKKYKGQLGYYRKALERLKGKQVKEIWFYSFSKDLDFRIE